MSLAFNKSAPQKAAEIIDGLEKLNDWFAHVENPARLKELLAEAHAQAQLTGEQAEQLAQDKEFMKTVGSMRAAINEVQENLKKAQDLCREDEEAFRTWRDAEMARLHDEKEENETTQRRLEGDAQALASDRRAMEKEYKDKIKALDEQEEKNETTCKINEKESKRLSKLAQKLDKRDLAVKIALQGKDDDEEEAA